MPKIAKQPVWQVSWQLTFKTTGRTLLDMKNSAKAQDTRSALIEAGIEQLSNYGYHGTGIKQILDAVNVPKGSFYNYFPSKEAFVADLLTHYIQSHLDEQDAFTANSRASPLNTLRQLFQKGIERYEAQGCQQGCLIGCLAAEIGSTKGLCQNAMKAAAHAWEERITTLIEQAQQQGEVRQDLPAAALARLVWSCWEGALLRMKLEGKVDPLQDVIDHFIDRLLAV
ncbi:TetR family transcriptional regulator C-terminal domain-containing protein [Endozoicomonas sp. SM1973]|uniref:TetR family transcriptional regulator C-terminal domain-containing protein n=1 Tax=Spartinivicinus marinus TaxID=2994442 RepID=A0A853I5N5_9GAMM|nr:TetR/AcrR family transcriptional regulator [Spartinivicinus marinus]MCX4028709.1 TetR family transcriptional regulator C-terminal domain-containing protein [Spartinivicinus marinus]NYZ68029.1 TetR family transcriptional regulator C-terminal domain-containing protein [Spartinivicinus marinus]